MSEAARRTARRGVELAHRLRRDGNRDAARRLVRRAAERIGADVRELPLLAADVADSTALNLPVPGRPVPHGTPLSVGWVCTPPGPGSGGHTTLFRMVEALETRGHRCVLFLYDRHGGDLDRHRAVVRRHWPAMRAEIKDATRGIEGVDGCVATSWESAHVLASRGTTAMRRLYFIQDYEPFFHPRGSLYSLAEDSYRFGFRAIALGAMCAELLKTEIGVKAEVVPFGCDTDTYKLIDAGTERTGVVFFARPNVPRRGYEMGILALERFHRQRPEQPIHLYGQEPRKLRFPVVSHGRLTPAELNELYNRTIAGLALSFTNVTLVAEEMLAAGNIPIVNASVFAGLDNPNTLVAAATPTALAAALSDAVAADNIPAQARRASASVRDGWTRAQVGVAAIIEREIYGTS